MRLYRNATLNLPLFKILTILPWPNIMLVRAILQKAYTIKNKKKKSGYFDRRVFSMIKLMVKLCLPEFSYFTIVFFLWLKFYAIAKAQVFAYLCCCHGSSAAMDNNQSSSAACLIDGQYGARRPFWPVPKPILRTKK